MGNVHRSSEFGVTALESSAKGHAFALAKKHPHLLPEVVVDKSKSDENVSSKFKF
jgi:hypothetical protein